MPKCHTVRQDANTSIEVSGRHGCSWVTDCVRDGGRECQRFADLSGVESRRNLRIIRGIACGFPIHEPDRAG